MANRLREKYRTEVFEALKDITVFRKVSVDPELETVVWPNGADLAPEFLKGLQNKQNQTTLYL